MLLHPRNLKHHVAAANRGRYALNAIALTPEGTLSTDGYSLLFSPYPDTDPAEVPKIDGVDPASPPPEVEPFLVSPEDAKKAAAMVGRPGRGRPPLSEFVQAEIDGDAVRFGATDLSNAQTMRVKRVEGQWPEVGRVIPDYREAVAVTLEIDQLLRAFKALKGSTTSETVTLRIVDDQTAVGMSCGDGTAMLVMPVPVEKPEEHVPCKLARLGTDPDGPPVAAPAEPDADDGDDPSDGNDAEPAIPTETEMEEAQEVYSGLPELPERSATPETPAATRKTPRRTAEPVNNELAEIIGG